MKTYQITWWERLISSTNKGTINEVCKQIVEDDTGHTDKLTQKLAAIILEQEICLNTTGESNELK